MKKWPFSKLYLGIEIWTFLKMSKIHFPFYFLVTLFFIFQNKENKEIFIYFNKQETKSKLYSVRLIQYYVKSVYYMSEIIKNKLYLGDMFDANDAADIKGKRLIFIPTSILNIFIYNMIISI